MDNLILIFLEGEAFKLQTGFKYMITGFEQNILKVTIPLKKDYCYLLERTFKTKNEKRDYIREKYFNKKFLRSFKN